MGTTTTAADGSYSIKVNTAVQTGSEVSIAVTDDSGQRGSITRILATAEVSVGAANADVPTDIGATTELLTVTGQVTTEDNGSYSVSFVNLLGIVAENGDLLKLQLSQASTGEISNVNVRLTTKQVIDKVAIIDVEFSGFNLSGAIAEADGKLLQTDSAVVVRIVNTGSGQSTRWRLHGAIYYDRNREVCSRRCV